MGCGASHGRGFSTAKLQLPPHVRRMLKQVEKEAPYQVEELERLWIEFSNLAEGRNAEKLCYAFYTKHKMGLALIQMVLEMDELNPENLQTTDEYDTPGDPFELFPLVVRTLGVLRKGSIAEQLQWYFYLFDLDANGELTPDELARMVKVLLENNPTMSDIATSEQAIMKLVEEIFLVADDNGDGVLSLKEFLAHSRFITKKILLQNTSFSQRTQRLMRKMHGDSASETTFTKYSSGAAEIF